jgi:hypothetical protein
MALCIDSNVPRLWPKPRRAFEAGKGLIADTVLIGPQVQNLRVENSRLSLSAQDPARPLCNRAFCAGFKLYTQCILSCCILLLPGFVAPNYDRLAHLDLAEIGAWVHD